MPIKYTLELTKDQLIALHQIVCVGRNPVNVQARSDAYSMIKRSYEDMRHGEMGIIDGKVVASHEDRVPTEPVVVFSGFNR